MAYTNYTDMKVNELREMCFDRGLPKSGKRQDLINRLKEQQQLQQKNIIKQETTVMQVEVSVIQQKQEVPVSPLVAGVGPPLETLSHIKYEYEPTSSLMETEEISTEDISIEQSNVEMSNEYSHSSIDQVKQQQIDLPPTSTEISSIPTHSETSMVEVPPPSTNVPFEQNDHEQSKFFDSLEKPFSTQQKDGSQSELKLELARLISERKCGTQNNKSSSIMFSRTNQGPANGIPYDYDFLLDIVQKSEIYKDGVIPDWFRRYYDTTFGTTYFGELECVRNIGIPVEDLFLFS